MRKALLFIIVLLHCIYLNEAQCPWNVSGGKKWSSASTWPSGSVPTSGIVTLPADSAVIYDLTSTSNSFTGIVVPANTKLILDGTKDVVLTTNYVDIKDGGAMIAGSATCPFTTKATITLVGPKDTSTSISGMGNKAIINAGRLEMFGNAPFPTWTRISSTVNIGQTSFTLKDTVVNWKVGGQIFLASTDYYQELSEVFTIIAISGNTITVDRPVKYLHWGAGEQYAEVGYLTRNILIEGDVSSDVSKFGGHVINYNSATPKIHGVEFNRMGQQNFIGKYPFHFHVQGDQIGKGLFVTSSSFHHGYQRCLTVHGTSGVLIKDNVGFNVTGHCYFLEEGSEMANTFDHNLGAWANAGTMIPTDNKASIFWITNPNNTFVNNAAVGGHFGFWFSMPKNPLGLTASQNWIYPRFTPLTLFENNVAHSAKGSGIFCDGGPDQYGVEQDFSYTPLVPPYTTSTQSYNTKPIRAVFKNILSYKNRNHGMWMKGGYLTVENVMLQDNGIGINTPGAGNIVQNSVIVGETDNIGTPGFTKYFNDLGRSRPRLWKANYRIHGWEGYDNAGAQFGRNLTFVNFVSDSVRDAGAVSALQSGPYILPPTDVLTQSTLVNSNVFVMEPNYDGDFRDGPNHVVIHDADGSLTGSYGSFIVTNNSILTFGGDCVQKSSWNNYFHCQSHQDGYSHVAVSNKDTSKTDFGDSLSKLIRATFIPFGQSSVRNGVTGGNPSNSIRNSYNSNVFSRKGYVLEFPHATPPTLQFNLRYAATGEWVVLALTYPKTATFTITRGYSKKPVTPVASLSALSSTTYYYDTTNQYLYVMYFEDNGKIESSAGFAQYGYGESYVDISASCGTTCSVAGTRPIPATFAHGEDNYRAKLQGCTAQTSSPYEGKAFLQYNPKTRRVSYMIYHNMPQATYARITGNAGTYFDFPSSAQSPIRGGFPISWSKFNELWNGTWTMTVGSDNAAHAISGKFGCVGSCSAPPKISTQDGCAQITKEVSAYKDNLNTTGGWGDWSWGSVRSFAYTLDAACGSNAVSVKHSGYGSLSLHLGNGDCLPGACTASWNRPYLSMASYAFLQFLVKSPSGPLIDYPLIARVQNHKGDILGEKEVNFNYINNYVIENSWTRVKIPLADLGVKSTDFVGQFSFLLASSLPAEGFTLLYDDIRLVPSYTDSITRSPVGSVKAYSETC